MRKNITVTSVPSLQRIWNRKNLFANLILIVAVALSLSSLSLFFTNDNRVFLLLFGCFFVLLLLRFFKVKFSEEEVINYLNRTYPQLQESVQLTTKSEEELTHLEKIQKKKTEALLNENFVQPGSIRNRTYRHLLFLFFSFFIFLTAAYLTRFSAGHSLRESSLRSFPEASLPEKKPSGITTSVITVIPPKYTRKNKRQQSSFNIIAEEKAVITWDITTPETVQKLSVTLNGKTVIYFTKASSEKVHWIATLQVTSSAFYQFSADGKKSELYAIEMIPDVPPGIIVRSPEQSTFISAGSAKKLVVAATATDDYGLDSLFIHATTASGSGEAVTFKQLAFPFPSFHPGNRKVSAEKSLDLASLGLTPGDELYFYISATDNNGAEKRSDVYVVRLEDTAKLMSLSGLETGLNIKPELFRSQRQIIIETERLLKDKDTLAIAQFNRRSDEIGTDQQMLRLRYGKYLGEETESEINPSESGGDYNISDFGNRNKVMDDYMDKHDNAEDAGFFDAATKKQLQSMLSEMWKASLQLKTYHPKAALPFEYNALRLLKELQQKERTYVAKTGVQLPPLNPGKRLSGELDKIAEPITKENILRQDSSLIIAREALSVLEKIRAKEKLLKEDKQTIRAALPLLSAMASSQPSLFLASYQSLQKINDGSYDLRYVTLAGKGLQRLIHSLYSVSAPAAASPDMGLSQLYYHRLKP